MTRPTGVPGLPSPGGTLDGYRHIARRLLDETLTPLAFETTFLRTWPLGNEHWSEAGNRVMERLFFLVEDYVDDDTLREPEQGDLDAEQLRAGVRRLLDETAELP